MKKIVLTRGLAGGAFLSAWVIALTFVHDAIGFDWGMVIGYSVMLVAFLVVFFGVRTYRDEVSGGAIGFGRALRVGALIALVASLCYVVTWEVIYFGTRPDFLPKYQAHVLAQARANGESEEAIARQKAEMDEFAQMYENPAINAAATFLEPLPVALVMVLVSAGVLSRRKKAGDAAAGGMAGAGVPT